MTDTQQINASVLADWLECVKQMRDSFKAYKATLDAYDTKKNFVDILAIRMECTTPDLDALRALVAEQEQASSWPEREVPPVGIADAKATAPQFAVGDTVKILAQPCRVSGHDDLIGKTGVVDKLGDKPWHLGEIRVCGDDFGWWFYKEDLALVSKAVTQ